MWAFVSQKPAQGNQEEKVLAVEPNDENEPEFDIIPDLELGEYEQMQSQPLGDTKVFLDQSHFSGDIEVTQDQSHQSRDIEVISGGTAMHINDAEIEIEEKYVVIQEPTFLKMFVEVSTKTEVAMGELQKEEDVTQEPISPKLYVESEK